MMNATTIFILLAISTFAQSLSHPHIWVAPQDKAEILQKVSSNLWAESMLTQYKSRVDPIKDSHKLDPSAVLSEIPGFPGSKKKHNTALTLGYESALLYWLTDDADYGQLAADILNHYATEISNITGDLEFTDDYSYSHLIDTREFYTKPPIIYDFVYSFLNNPNNKVYSIAVDSEISFDLNKTQKAFIKMADEVFTKGSINSNHPILEAPGALFNLLSIENDSTRAVYFSKFMNGTPKQNGLNWMMEVCKNSTLWPEATGYSIGPHRIILELMIVTDQYAPSLNIVSNNREIIENALFFENYKFPDSSSVMRFGDAHRYSLNTISILERVLKLSKTHSYTQLENTSLGMLQALYKAKGGYSPKVSTQSLEWNNPYHLLWGETIETNNPPEIDYARSINIDYAGIAMQRNIQTNHKSKFGLMAYTGGAHYVHSHLTGIDMELYGLGAAIGSGGGDVGASNRNDNVFRNYHRIYAGHNTVIVNGTSKGLGKGAWKADNQLLQQTTKTIASEPSSLEAAISNDFSFSVQELNDDINNSKQQRVLSIIRTSDSTGYYYDVFRSKSLDTDLYHDYVYHNIGDSVHLKNLYTNNSLSLSNKPNRYQSTSIPYGGKTVEFPGWHFFEDVKTSSLTSEAVLATIPMSKQNSGFMHINIPGGETREYSSIMGPATIEGQLGYENEKTPIISIRQYGEAWKKPFVNVFEPSTKTQGSVTNVENLNYGGKIVGTKVTSFVENDTIVDYILSNIFKNDLLILNQGQISFEGRFAIIRTQSDSTTLYIGDGKELSFRDMELTAQNRKGITTLPSTLTQDTSQFTSSLLWSEDSMEINQQLQGLQNYEDTLITTLTMDIYLDSIFTVIDTLRGTQWVGADTLLESSSYRRVITDSIMQVHPYENTVSNRKLIQEIPSNIDFEVSVYNTAGQRVFNTTKYQMNPLQFEWNRKNNAGSLVPQGYYFMKIQLLNQAASKVIRIRIDSTQSN